MASYCCLFPSRKTEKLLFLCLATEGEDCILFFVRTLLALAFAAACLSVFSFPGDNLSKYQWIFTKLGVRIAIGGENLVRDF